MSTSALFSFTMKLGFGSTKCGSSVGRASVARSLLSPPISRAIAAMSGVVTTTFSFAWAAGTPKPTASRRAGKVFIGFIGFIGISELVRGVSAEEEFKLQPDGMIHADVPPVVVVVLQAN